MYRASGIESDGMGKLPVFTLPEIRNTVLENASLENEELLQLNRIINRDERQLRREQTNFAQYVGFPNQSYMGKVFKKLRNMTPMSYRDCFKNQEAET